MTGRGVNKCDQNITGGIRYLGFQSESMRKSRDPPVVAVRQLGRRKYNYIPIKLIPTPPALELRRKITARKSMIAGPS
jgi:hypothetical protein